MYLTTHAAVGVLIAEAVKNPTEAFFLAFASHFVLDVIPHGDEHVEEWARKKSRYAMVVAFLDIGLLTAFLASLYATNNLPRMALISAGVIGSVLPDLLSIVFPVIHHYTSWFFLVRIFHWTQRKMGLPYVWRGHNWFHHWTHRRIHKHISLKWGIVLQVFIIAVSMVLAMRFV